MSRRSFGHRASATGLRPSGFGHRATSPALTASRDMPAARVARNHLLLAVAILGLIAAALVLRRLGG